MTWFQLWKKIGVQPMSITRHKEVTIKLPDGEYACKLVYPNGTSWHLEIESKIGESKYETSI